MAGKITELTALTGAAAANGDLLEVVDVSDTTMAGTGTNKRIALDELGNFLGGGAVPYNIPSTAGAGGSSVHGLFPGVAHVGAGANLAAVDGTMYGFPLIVPFDITISSVGTQVITGAGSSLVRAGFVPADANWVPTTGVVNVGTFDSTASAVRVINSLSITLTAGRWFRIWRAEGGAPSLYGPRVLYTFPMLTFNALLYAAPASWWPTTGTGSGAFADTIAAFNLGSISGSYSGGSLNTIGFIDPWVATWTAA